MSEELDYIDVLRSIQEIPFNVGKKLLIDFITGNDDNKSIKKNRLYSYSSFGCLAYTSAEVDGLINSLILNNMIGYVSLKANKFWKVLELTKKGKDEILTPTLNKKKISFNFTQKNTEITDQDKTMFKHLNNYLKDYNDYQKKAIITKQDRILCIAGAGSGKTTVLTKRIEFLVRYQSVNPNKILAITFTKKARQEMLKRLLSVGGLEFVKVETFNSFCEKILRRYNDLIYDKRVNVISYREKIILIRKALSSMNSSMESAISIYFTDSQRRLKSKEELANIFLNDIFFLRDFFKFKNMAMNRESFNINLEHERSLDIVLNVCKYIEEHMNKLGLRDFADQLIDALRVFKENPNLIPEFEHVLVDEYQDVNETQMKLIEVLNPKNIFCVGDPRQSIFGWRGSDVRHILKFEEKYPACEIINLAKNYRSTKKIVKLINTSIRNMGLCDLESEFDSETDIKLIKLDSEKVEFEFVIQKILENKIPRNEIFVLARTNRQLKELSKVMKARYIKHVIRSDELRRSVIAETDEVTLATIHAIKGMEAECVFVIGCNPNKFPCKASDHPILDMVDAYDYDKHEEERRLFYVAMSRAKTNLYLTHTSKSHTYFITDEMLKLLTTSESNLKAKTKSKLKSNPGSSDIVSILKSWRREKSEALSVPPYIIMHDKTLLEISSVMPTSTIELQNIHGMGPTKIMKFGKEILEIISEK